MQNFPYGVGQHSAIQQHSEGERVSQLLLVIVVVVVGSTGWGLEYVMDSHITM